MKRLLKLRDDQKAHVASMRGLLDAAGDTALTDEQDTQYKAMEAKLATITAGIAREEKLEAAEASHAANFRLTEPVVTAESSEKPFHSLGDNLQAIARAGMGTATSEDYTRLNAAASGGSGLNGPDGAFLIQKEFSVDLTKEGFGASSLASKCASIELGANADGLEVVYVDETSRATGSRWGGVQVYRVAEAETVTAKKPKIGMWELRLQDMMGLAYMTDRLLADAGAMQAVYATAFAEEFAFKLDDEIFRGSGAAQCMGVLNAPATISVAKETGQLADTVVAENVIKMWSRINPASKARGQWYINTEVETQLPYMQIGTGTSGQLVYMAPGGLSGAQYGTIYGRPVQAIEHASALGDVGDLTFLDLSRYQIITKGGLQQAESIHVRFLYNEKAFRWVTRVNGAPKDKAPVTAYKGSNTTSPFVTLAAR